MGKSWTCIVAAALALPAVAQTPTDTGIGYPSVAAALEGLRAKPGTSVAVQSGWTVVSEDGGLTIWSFTPAGHPAHPAVVKRSIVEEDGAFLMNMRGLCEAAKPACDQLMAEFEKLNKQMQQSIRRGRQP